MYQAHVAKARGQTVIPTGEYIMKINNIRNTVKSLEESLIISRSLETERWLRYSNLKTKNRVMIDDLKKADKRNRNMLNLFRQSVTDIRLGSEIVLPEPLKREVQRTWHQKYDALLMQNKQLKRDIDNVSSHLEERTQEISNLHQKMLALGDRLVQRNEAVENICNKYLTLRKRKNEQVLMLRKWIEILQDELEESKNEPVKDSIVMPVTPTEDILLARETRRGERLAYKNSLLRTLLLKANICTQNGQK